MKIYINPVPKPRMTRSDKWKKRKCVLEYRAFCDELRLKHPNPLPINVQIDFILEIPQSKKKSIMSGWAHQQKPDLDNLVKAVLDALCEDDSHIARLHASKVWGETPCIIIKEI